MEHVETGTIKVIEDLKTFPSGFTKREFVITTNDKYPQDIKFEVTKDKVTIKCKDHGNFRMKIGNLLTNHQWCKKCNPNTSKAERELTEFIKNYIPIVESDKTILEGKELDIYVPSKNLAIEFNGLYWHSDKFKPDNYHLNKTKKCKEKNVRLIHIFEDEWTSNQELVKSRLLSMLGINTKRIYARNTKVMEVPTDKAMKFLNDNHIQGKVGAKIKLGLYQDDKLLALMTFGKTRINMGGSQKEGEYELMRFCSKQGHLIVGGASKLLKHFINNYNPKKIISYADLRWSQGNVYEKLGFNKEHESRPNYFYTKGESRENRYGFRKDILIKQGFSKNKSERKIMEDRGYYRIYDCGTIKYSLILN